MLNAIVFVLRTRVDGKTDFVQRMNSDGKSWEPKALTWVGHGSHGSFYKVLGRMPVQEVFDHELLVRSKRGKLFVAGLQKPYLASAALKLTSLQFRPLQMS